jgi:hypothetical protein
MICLMLEFLLNIQGTGAAQKLHYDERVMGPTYPTANCDPTIPEDLNTHFYQGTVIVPSSKILQIFLFKI